MRGLAWILAVFFFAATVPDAALAQAATGGTKDTAAPTMVFPIRPRNEPPSTTAVPNIAPPQQPVVRLRRAYPYYIHRFRH